MKAIFLVFCILFAINTTKALTFDEVKEVFIGVIEGIALQTNMTDVVPCLKDTYNEGLLIEEAIKDFESKDPAQVKDGIQKIGQAISGLPDAMDECKAAASEVKKLRDMLVSFTSPKSFVYHIAKDLIINGIQIYKDIDGAINSYKNGEYEPFGEDIGNALAAIFIGQQLQTTANLKSIDILAVKQVFIGVLKGIGQETGLDAFEKCFVDLETDAKILEEAINDLKIHDITHVKDAIEKIGTLVKSLPQAMQECKSGVATAEKLIQFLKSFTNPMSFVYHVGKDLLINRVNIFHDIDDAITQYNNKNYQQFGFDIGHALATIFIGQSVEMTYTADDYNKLQSSWIAHDYEQFKGKTHEELAQNYLGLTMLDKYDVEELDVSEVMTYAELPASFDARTQWPNCIHPIRNQQQCGSCWAFAGTEVLSDRLCIATNGKINEVLSPQYLVSCDSTDHGCHGGRLDSEWAFIEKNGVCTEACMPYESGSGTAPSCAATCKDGSPIKTYKAKAGSTKQLTNPDAIKLELITNGPVETGFIVFKDFMSYKSGIYERHSWIPMGGHAVKIVGWGVENGTNFWIVANSWDVTWGENGYFRIKMGAVQIDKNAFAGLPELQTKIRGFLG